MKQTITCLIICVAMLTSFQNEVIAQEPTKTETINWIIKKLNDYNKAGMALTNSTFSYDNAGDKIKCQGSFAYNYDAEWNKIVIIPLSQINQVSFDPIESTMTIKTIGKKIQVLKLKKYMETEPMYDTNEFVINIDYDSENDLKERFRKAWNRLLSFYTKEKEAF